MERIQDLLHPVVAGILRRSPFSDEKLVCAWRLAVGADLARISHVRAEHGAVIVRLDDRRWLKELERSRALIQDRLRMVLGDDVAARLTFEAPAATSGPARRGARKAAPRKH